MKEYVLGVDFVGKNNIEISNILEKYNIKMLNTDNVQEAINVTSKFHKSIKLIIWSVYTDNDREFKDINKLKQLPVCKNIPLIVISNFNDSKFVLKAINAGATDYIVTPFSKELIVNKVKDVISLHSRETEDEIHIIEEDEETKLLLSLKDIISMHIKGASRANYEVLLFMLSLGEINSSSQKKQNDVINTIIKILKSNLRETDFIIKYKFNTVFIILPFIQKDKVDIINKKIKSIIMNSEVLKQKAEGLIVTSSSQLLTQEYKDKEELLLKKLKSNSQIYVAFPEQNTNKLSEE